VRTLKHNVLCAEGGGSAGPKGESPARCQYTVGLGISHRGRARTVVLVSLSTEWLT
jgi:hypothetical protein